MNNARQARYQREAAPTRDRTAVASCTCGWLRVADTTEDAHEAASVHALVHKAKGQAVELGPVPRMRRAA